MCLLEFIHHQWIYCGCSSKVSEMVDIVKVSKTKIFAPYLTKPICRRNVKRQDKETMKIITFHHGFNIIEY
jgi:adenine C2-methylase RlmN of 23S rRNA A2503 and tRNA A37